MVGGPISGEIRDYLDSLRSRLASQPDLDKELLRAGAVVDKRFGDWLVRQQIIE